MIESENYPLEEGTNQEYIQHQSENVQDNEIDNVIQTNWHRSIPDQSYNKNACLWWCCWNPECEALNSKQHMETITKNTIITILFILSVWIICTAITNIIFSYKKTANPTKKSLIWWSICCILIILIVILVLIML